MTNHHPFPEPFRPVPGTGPHDPCPPVPTPYRGNGSRNGSQGTGHTQEEPMTTTTHSPTCTRPGWTVERSTGSVEIKRCTECGAVELRTEVARGPGGVPSLRTDHREGGTT